MNVAILLEGRSFYAGWKRHAPYQDVNFAALRDVIRHQTGDGTIVSLTYYMGTDQNGQLSASAQQRTIESTKALRACGFAVETFPIRVKHVPCPKCGGRCEEIVEKQVDSAIAVDAMKLLHQTKTVDTFVLVSSDSDQLPVIRELKKNNRNVWLAVWNPSSVAEQMLDAVDGIVSLFEHQHQFLTAAPSTKETSDNELTAMLGEIERAERQFQGGYVGANYFLTVWKSKEMIQLPAERSKLLSTLIQRGLVQEYDATDGNRAIRRTQV